MWICMVIGLGVWYMMLCVRCESVVGVMSGCWMWIFGGFLIIWSGVC